MANELEWLACTNLENHRPHNWIWDHQIMQGKPPVRCPGVNYAVTHINEHEHDGAGCTFDGCSCIAVPWGMGKCSCVKDNEKVNASDEHDAVNHPKHYNSHPSGVECIAITRHMGFNLGNVVKYVWRDGIKDAETPIQDLEKAMWYLRDEIEMRKKAAGE